MMGFKELIQDRTGATSDEFLALALGPMQKVMVADALTNLALSWRTILNTFKRSEASGDLGMEDVSQRVPNSWWLTGLALGTTSATLVASTSKRSAPSAFAIS